MHKITDTYDTTPLWNAITPKASLPGPSWVFTSPELHQHLIRDRFISHSRRRVNVWKLKSTRVHQRTKALFYKRLYFAWDVPDTVYTWKPILLVSHSQGSSCSMISRFP